MHGPRVTSKPSVHMTVCRNLVGGFSKNACLLWLSYLGPTTRYFEWGSGFTTRTADRVALHVTSIEGSRAWYEKMRAHNFSSRTDLRYVDIGETGAYSWPRNQRRSSAYVQAIQSAHDIVLVDGRWRVACAVSAFPFVTGRLLIHDFGRNAYQSVLRLYVKEREVDGLAVLRRRDNVSAADLERHLQQFKHHAD